ncbi:MAG TPA: hypothetical protein VGS41_03370, partial [Chthonomonadales bacterium]|nr:hypothetical protein [Chthonomonadales bacterium]
MSCGPNHGASSLPKPGQPLYNQVTSAFFGGVIGLQVGDQHTVDEFLQCVKLAPGEPAGWADLALAYIRLSMLDKAAPAIAKAKSLKPDDSRVWAIYGLFLSREQKSAEAAAAFRKSIELDPTNISARYSLIQELQRLPGPESDAETQTQLLAILQQRPRNLVALTALAMNAAGASNSVLLARAVAGMRPLSAIWPAEARARFADLARSAQKPDFQAAVAAAAYTHNLLTSSAPYQRGVKDLHADQGVAAGEPVDHFLIMQTPPPTPAPADTALAFAPQPLQGAAGRWGWAKVLELTPALESIVANDFQTDRITATPGEPPSTVVADGRQVLFLAPDGTRSAQLPFPGGPSAAPPSPDSIVAFDMDYSFREGIALAGAGGIRLYRRPPVTGTAKDSVLAFQDGSAGLPAAARNSSYYGAWPVDIESDGDLDLVAAPTIGPPLVLRNN